jgi:aminoglycoside 6'-N-acetyltransferase
MSNFENTIILLMGIAGVGKRAIAQSMVQQDNSFHMVLNDSWVDPILRLFGDEPTVMNDLTPAGWAAIHKACDVILDTITYVCPKSSNFVITNELLDGNQWHQDFYKKIEALIKNKNAHFVPVRLICDTSVLLKRVVSEDRRSFRKTMDAHLVENRANTSEVFKTNHKNELTLDTTNLTTQQSAEKIYQHLSKVLK